MTIKNRIEDGYQLSPYLLVQLHEPISIQYEGLLNDPYERLVAILLLMDLISKLGWVEHTSDWDIGAFIFLKDGTKIEVPQGYGDCLTLHDSEGNQIKDYQALPAIRTQGFTLQLTEENTDTDDECVNPFSINLWDIQAISFFG